MPHLILIGMMGSGKSTVGRILAEETGVPFADSDAVLEVKMGRTISQMFNLYGEDAFRSHETAVLRSFQPDPGILATGGGIVTREENWDEFERLGQTIFLDVREDVLLARLAASNRKRPLLEFEDWEERFRQLMARRRPLYERADYHVEIGDEEFEDVVDKILNMKVKG